MKKIEYDWDAHHERQADKLRSIFTAVAEGKSVSIDPECKHFVRIVGPENMDRYHFGRYLDFAFTGGIFAGNPKFGVHEFVGGGVTTTTNGTKGIFVDCYPMGRVNFPDIGYDVASAEQAVKDILEDEGLMNQIQNFGFIEVQFSSGQAVNLESHRPRVEIPVLAR